MYCKFGNFRENFIFANSVKRHICDVQTSQLRHDLPISLNDRVVLLFREGLTFSKLPICEVSRKKTFAKIFGFTVLSIFHARVPKFCHSESNFDYVFFFKLMMGGRIHVPP